MDVTRNVTTNDRGMRRAVLSGAGLAAAALALWNRGAALNAALLLLARTRHLPEGVRRMRVSVPGAPGWIPLQLQADLSKTLAEVTGRPWEGAAWSRFGGFGWGRPYASFYDPTSPRYQAWVGAYAVLDGAAGERFGFTTKGRPALQDTLDVLEADQRLVLRGAGCPHWFQSERGAARRVRTTHRRFRYRQEGAWWVLEGQAETFSTFHRGTTANGRWHHRWQYGVVPEGAFPGIEEFAPLTYAGVFQLRYVPAWRASVARFAIWPQDAPDWVADECRGLLYRVRFEDLRN